MEWERETCLKLIDEYEKQEILWNPRHGSYYNKLKKNEAWILISRAVECSTEESKKKMESLLSSYRREKAKGTRTIGTRKGAQEVYVSKWFAFNRMAFLKDRDKHRSTTSTLAPDDDNESSGQGQEGHEDTGNETESQIAATDSEHTMTTPVPSTPTPVTHVTTASSSSARKSKSKKKRKMPKEDARIDGALSILKSAVSNSSLEDDCCLFGQYIANKLRNYDPRTRAIVQHEINNSIFNADMNFYQQPLTSSGSYTFTAFRPQNAFDNSSIESSPSPQLLITNQHQYCAETQGQSES